VAEVVNSPYLVLFARLLLAGVLLVAGVGKLRENNPGLLLAEVSFLPLPLARLAARLLPFVELAIGGLLLLGLLTNIAGLAAAAMFLLFSIVLARKLLLGKTENCHCFGSFSAGTLTWGALLRNLLLLTTALLLTFTGSAWLALDYLVVAGRQGVYPPALDGLPVLLLAGITVVGIVFGGRVLGYIRQTLQAV